MDCDRAEKILSRLIAPANCLYTLFRAWELGFFDNALLRMISLFGFFPLEKERGRFD